MIDMTGVTHHHAIEEIVDVLCNRTENTDRKFFRAAAVYFLGKMASCMRANILTKDRGEIPVNIYTVALATSGYGKGYSVGILEEELLAAFRKRFIGHTMPVKTDENVWVIANERAVRNQSDQQVEYDGVNSEIKSKGAYLFAFDNGTPEGVKQLRQKLLLSSIGSINYQVDEIGSNLDRSMEVLTLFLELYDQGRVKQKLTKNTAENIRTEEIEGKTPCNMLLFGTPSKVFDGGATEKSFMALLEVGYGRRSIFAYGDTEKKSRNTLTGAEIYQNLVNPANDQTVKKWSDHFHDLAEPSRYGWQMTVDAPVGIRLLDYKIQCEALAEEMKENQPIHKAEMAHRFFKALKIAGVLAFVDASNEIEMDHLMQAILLTEESGEAFSKLMSRDPPQVRLGRYIADMQTELTHHDLLEALPFYPKGQGPRNEMMSLARAWGYKNNVIIRKTVVDSNDFFHGETLEETDLSQMIVSYSNNWAYDYAGERVPFDELHRLMTADDMHWCNHHFRAEHRLEENVVPGFNMLVLDVDGGISAEMVHELLKDIKHLTYTTKRSTPQANRFRLLIPMNFKLALDKDDYKECVNDIIAWLPFKTADVDQASNQRSKKWMTNPGSTVHYSMAGDMFDVLPFIPKTKKNEDYRVGFKEVQSMDNLERWFLKRVVTGDRNNQMIKYALALVDTGLDLLSVGKQVHAFNLKLDTPMDASEIDNTIMVSVARKYRAAA